MNLILILKEESLDKTQAILDKTTLTLSQKIFDDRDERRIYLDLKEADALREWLNKNLPR